VQEFTTPLVTPVVHEHTLADLPHRKAAQSPQHIALRRLAGERWEEVTAAAFAEQVRTVAKGFIAAGLEPGDKVAILSRTSYEWTLLDFAAWAAGLVPVPIYETSSPDQIHWILSDSHAHAIVMESAKHAQAFDAIRGDLHEIAHVWRLDEGGIRHLTEGGSGVPDAALDDRMANVHRDSTATLIYTSGTTGRPKGCALTHGNFLTLAEQAIAEMPEILQRPGASTLLFLPLAHVFARFIEVLAIAAGATLAHTADIPNITTHLQAVQPTFVLAVPRVFEKIYNKAEASAVAGGKGAIFTRAAETAIAYSTALQDGRVPLTLRARHALFDRLVYRKLRELMGGHIQYAVSGGAPLGARLGHFFRGVGITILEGYGLTETTAPATVNLPSKVKIGTVGPPLPGVTLRIASDGEIIIRGINVFHDYRNNPEATAEALRDGWFHTGDIGEIDADGYLKITGRKKEILITAGGKNVVPGLLEDQLRAHPLISQACVVGDQQPFVAALLTLDAEMVPEWSKNAGLGAFGVAEARTNDVVLAELQKAVDRANETVSKAESIRKFAVLPEDFTEEAGQLTPSLKLKRHVVMTQFADDVAALYT